jgi:capsular exopolysaccharide synthesis family protein
MANAPTIREAQYATADDLMVGDARMGSDPDRTAAGPRLRNWGRSFLRRGKLILFTVIVLNGLAIFGVTNLTPRYTAESAVLVGPREEQVVDLKAVLSGLGGDSDVIESEIQVLKSRDIARGIVHEFKLDQRPEFNPALRPAGFLHVALGFLTAQYNAVASWAGLGGHGHATTAIGGSPLAASPLAQAPLSSVDREVSDRDPISPTVDAFLQRLDIASKGRSRVIGVSFTSTSPMLAEKIANAVADAYIASQLKAKTDATAQAHTWLDSRVAELRQQVIEADEATEAYRRKSGLVQGRESKLLTEQTSEIGTELMRAQEDVATAEGRMKAVADINTSPLGLKEDLIAARAREKRLSDNLAALTLRANAGNESEIQLKALQLEADADRALYDRLLARAKETKVQSGLQQPDAKIISRAEWPQEPSFPKPALILPAMFFASCLIAALLVVAVESLDRGFNSVEELEDMFGLPAVGIVPLLKRRVLRKRAPGAFILDEPGSAFAEAIRSLHTSLMLSNVARPPKVVLLASALPGEGKTSVCLALARMMASCGKRVVLIDTDLRRPALHKAFGKPRGPGLTDFLAGEAKIEEIVHRDPLSPAYLLPAGSKTNTAPDLFASNTMRDLVAAFAERFDLVLLDCAPVLAVSDSRHLCRLADQTVFVVRWQHTRCHAVIAAMRQTISAGGRIGSVLLSMVDLDAYGRYSTVGSTQRRIRLYLAH